MKPEKNNEMDLLLRRLGRRPEASASDGNGHAEHLDADELSCYAENVLPAAARARYTEHLAECARCREVVVRLSSSVSVVAAEETTKVAGPSAWRKLLASLFSPMVLRYAVPALGLVVVAVIGLIVMQQRQPEADVAMRNSPQPTAAPADTSEPNADYNAEYGASAGMPEANKSAARAESSSETAVVPNATPPGAAAGGIVVAPLADASAPKAEEQAAAKEAPAAPKATTDNEDLQKKKIDFDAARRDAKVVAANEPPRPAAVNNASVDERKADEVAPASGRSISKLAELRPGVAATRRRGSDEEKDDSNAETRTVGGRRFRKEGNVWIDTAYNSSRGVMTLTRGSEQYRSLIADEPVIKEIAEQLEGEIIVVWKTRTYRIR